MGRHDPAYLRAVGEGEEAPRASAAASFMSVMERRVLVRVRTLVIYFVAFVLYTAVIFGLVLHLR